MIIPTHHVSAITSELPKNLKPLTYAAKEVGLAEQTLWELSDRLWAPHWRVDDSSPLFRIGELKDWILANALNRPNSDMEDTNKRPLAIRGIVGIRDITRQIGRSGIYFLCKDDDLIYIGQSNNVHGRVSQHRREKSFTKAFYLEWPADDLDRIEGALIRELRPRLNGRNAPRIWKHIGKARIPAEHDEVILSEIMSSARWKRVKRWSFGYE